MPLKDPEARKAYNKAYNLKNKDKIKEKKKCEHKYDKSICKECDGASICPHNRIKTQCIECDGNNICEHKRLKGTCKECGGNEICVHNKRRPTCRECGGSRFCVHNKSKSVCRYCGGGSLCIHNRVKNKCIECDGGNVCEHKKQKNICKECYGNSICEHLRIVYACKECNFQYYLVCLQRGRIRRIMSQTTIAKSMTSIEYLDCSMTFFEEFIKRKMTPDMTFDNIHYDHIKPISKFNLEDPEELMKCCHYTNFQPLLANDNLVKSDKWSDLDDIFWNEYIIYKDYTAIYMPK